ncbi:MAG: tyrosine-type recombinase/integrase, partial [Dehalococcoidia bacterium]
MASIERRETATGAVRWTMRVFLGRDPDTGKRKFITQTFDRKKEADAEARRLERQRDQGTVVQPSKEAFGTYLSRWLDAKEGQVRARTIHDYRGMVARYITEPPEGAPLLAMKKLSRLVAADFDDLYTFLWREKGLSPRTLQFLHAVLRQALKDAVKRKQLATNPTDHVRPPTRPQEHHEGGSEKKVRAMSETEAGAFLKAARDDRYYALWTVLLTGGLRPGEALALTWADVDLEEGRVHVQRALTRTGVPKICECGHGRDAHDGRRGPCKDVECEGCDTFTLVKGWRLVPPKTKKGRRVVPLPDIAMRALREWRPVQLKERLALGAEYEDAGFVFCTPFGRPLDQTNLFARNFKNVMAAAKLGSWETVRVGKRVKKDQERFRPAFRMYDLRHTCATFLLKKGVNPKIVQER